jgi:16S rRNA processing protein RimM
LTNSEKILIAKITSPHGLGGQVKGQFFTDSFDNFLKLAGAAVKSARKAGHDAFIATLENVADRTGAEAAVGMEIFAPRSTLPAPAEDTYYVSDLVGMESFRGNESLGKIAAMHNFGAGDIMELESGEMVSFAGAKVDMDKRTINIK